MKLSKKNLKLNQFYHLKFKKFQLKLAPKDSITQQSQGGFFKLSLHNSSSAHQQTTQKQIPSDFGHDPQGEFPSFIPSKQSQSTATGLNINKTKNTFWHIFHQLPRIAFFAEQPEVGGGRRRAIKKHVERHRPRDSQKTETTTRRDDNREIFCYFVVLM